MKTRTKIILATFLLITLIISGLYVDATNFSSNRVHITYKTLTSSEIPDSFDDVSIALISDIQYGTFMDKTRLESFLKKLVNIQPDIVLFSGDLFDKDAEVTEEYINELEMLLSSIQAPLGKFAVIGDNDKEYEEIYKQIMFNSNFELIDGNIIKLANRSTNYINLIGLHAASGQNNMEELFTEILPESYTIALCHTPDIAQELPRNQVDILLTGHSHSSQINFPLIGINESEATKYRAGQHITDSTTIYVSHGLGTSEKDIRLFSDPEIIVFRFQTK